MPAIGLAPRHGYNDSVTSFINSSGEWGVGERGSEGMREREKNISPYLFFSRSPTLPISRSPYAPPTKYHCPAKYRGGDTPKIRLAIGI